MISQCSTACVEAWGSDRSPRIADALACSNMHIKSAGDFLFCGKPSFGREVIDDAREMLT